MFYRQLAILFEANIPPLDALTAMAEQAHNPLFKDILFEIETDVRGGESLSKAMVKHKKVFSSFYISVIEAGESTGKLSEVLKYLADHAERDYILNSKIRGAFVYPAFILFVFFAVAILMLVYVVPQLIAVLIETGGELPFTTKLLIGTSRFLRSWIWLVVLVLIAIGSGLRRYIATIQGRELWDKIKLGLPILGGVFRKICLARFAENFSTLLKGGLPILNALRISSQIVGNKIFEHLIERATEEVKKGGNISTVFEKDKKNIPVAVVQMMKVGEKTAKLDTILERLSVFYREEVNRTVDSLTQLIEPVLIIVLGGGVAFLVASILMPIYNITSGGF
jgi:type IV pilus assembly protein PilC